MPDARPHPTKTQEQGIGLPIFLIIWPIVLLPILAALSFIVGAIFPDTPPVPGSDALFDTPSIPKAVMNSLVFLGGAFTVIAGLPSLIIGIVILSKRRPK